MTKNPGTADLGKEANEGDLGVPPPGSGEGADGDVRRPEVSALAAPDPAASARSAISPANGSAPGVARENNDGSPRAGPAETVVASVVDPKKLIATVLTWFGRLYDRHPRVFGLTAIGLLVAALAARMVGVDLFAYVPKVVTVPETVEGLPIVRDVTWTADLSDPRECVTLGKALSKKYVLLHVLQWVQYEDGPGRRQRLVDQRIAYTVLPLVDITDGEQVFAEDYQGSGLVIRWHGPRRETEIPGTTRYQVSFSGKKGVPLTIITGAKMIFNLPFPPVRPAFRSSLQIGANQDFWAYENTEDVICEITQIVDSRSLRLTPFGRGGNKVGTDGRRIESDVMLQPQTIPPIPNSALSATWRLVAPGEDVGQVFSW